MWVSASADLQEMPKILAFLGPFESMRGSQPSVGTRVDFNGFLLLAFTLPCELGANLSAGRSGGAMPDILKRA